MTPAAWRYAARRTLREYVEDDCFDAAAALTYFAVVSVFPGLLAVIGLATLLGEGHSAVGGVLDVLAVVLPATAADALRGPLDGFAAPADAPYLLGGGALLALWTASGYVSAFARVMNRIWEVPEGRPYWRRRLEQLGITAGVLLVTAAAITAGVALHAPVGVRVGVLAVASAVLLVVLYGATPNVRRPRIGVLGPGGLLALLLIAAASAGFALYVNGFSHYSRSYGSLAGLVVLLIWLFIVNLAALFGAELDAELERARELQAGEPAARRLLVLPRSTTEFDRHEAADDREAAAGTALSRADGDR